MALLKVRGVSESIQTVLNEDPPCTNGNRAHARSAGLNRSKKAALQAISTLLGGAEKTFFKKVLQKTFRL